MPKPENTVRKTFVVEFADLGKSFLDAASDLIKSQGVAIPALEIEAPIPSDDCTGYIAALPELIEGARQRATEGLLDPARFKSELDLINTAKILAQGLEPVSVSLPGGGGNDFVVEGDYARNEGPFSDVFYGVTAEEAKFQARWQMTENAGHKVHENPRTFASVMSRHWIREVTPEPTPERRVRELLADLVREAQGAGHSGPALDAALAAAQEMGLDVSPAEAPRM